MDNLEKIEDGFLQGEFVNLKEGKSDVIGKLTGLLSLSRQLDIDDLESVTKEKLKELVSSIKTEDY